MPTIVCQECGHHNPHNTQEERFWNQVDKSGDCWLWQGARDPLERGVFQVLIDGQKKQRRTHRVAWMFTIGPIPDGMCVCHKCDVPLCCNPDHLFLGTTQENTADKVAKGRQIRGTDQHDAKLTEDDVRIIRTKAVKGSYSALAREYGISDCIIGRIVRGELWKHVV